ncbi:MAG: hypothetical protein RL637_1207 [Pseudomonadota bacterium]|jgi:hypothetical protein
MKYRWLFFLFYFYSMVNANATIFYSKNEALELAFGKEVQTELLSLFPDKTETAAIENLAKVKLESGLLSIYVGKQQGKIKGYAAIESEIVRSKPETIMVVLSPEGQVDKVILLAFHEPPEYQPTENWFDQFKQKKLEELELNNGIQGISGATLSTRSTVNTVRKVLAVYQILIKKMSKP